MNSNKFKPKVAIIVLNWNGWRDTIECIESIFQNEYDNYELIVVDNGSSDDSVNNIKKYCEGKFIPDSSFLKTYIYNKPIILSELSDYDLNKKIIKKNKQVFSKLPSNAKMTLILNSKNYGFAKGNNIGMNYVIKNTNADYILLLNNDTYVNKSFLNKMIKITEESKKIGIIGSKIYYYNYNGNQNILWHAGGMINMWTGYRKMRGYRKMDDLIYSKKIEVDYVSGAVMLIKKNVIKNIGFFDESYFTYTEDIDYCFRAKKNGYKIVYSPESIVWHKVSKSTEGEMGETTLFYIVRNSLLFMRKNAKIYHYPSYMFFSMFLFIRRFLLVNNSKKKSMLKGILSSIHMNITRTIR